MATGKIKWYDVKKGFGFIVPDQGSKDVFMHISGWSEQLHPQEGQAVTYDLGSDKQGKSCAVNVKAA